VRFSKETGESRDDCEGSVFAWISAAGGRFAKLARDAILAEWLNCGTSDDAEAESGV